MSPSAKAGTNRVTDLSVGLIAVLAGLVLVPWLDKPIYRDEGASLYSAQLSWSGLLHQSRVVDLVILPYYVLLHFWVLVSDTIWWARSLSLLAFVATIYLVGHTAGRFGGRWCGLVAALVLATNPLMIAAALDARPYALTTLAATAAIVSLLRWADGGAAGWMWWFALSSLATALLQIFSTLAPLSVLVAVFLICNRRVRDLWRSLLAPLAVFAVPVLVFGIGALHQRGQLYWIKLGTLRHVAEDLLGPASGSPRWYVALVLLLAAVSLLVCALAWKRGALSLDRDDLAHFAVAFVWAVGPAVVLVAGSFVVPVFIDRYVTSSSPGLALTIGLLVAWIIECYVTTWPRLWRVATVVGAAAVIAVTVVGGMVPDGKAYAQDFGAVSRYLSAKVGPDGQAILLDHSLTEAVSYYWSKDHQRAALWPELADQPYIEGLDVREDAGTMAKAPANAWLVNDNSVVGTSGFITKLEGDGYKKVGVATFVGVEVIHFQRSAS